jgi:hypothetical protein
MFKILSKMSNIRFSRATFGVSCAAATAVIAVDVYKNMDMLKQRNLKEILKFTGKTALHAGLAFVGVGLSSEGWAMIFKRTPVEYVWGAIASETLVSMSLNHMFENKQPDEELQQDPNKPMFHKEVN